MPHIKLFLLDDPVSNREQKKEGWESKVRCMRDEIDEEVKKLLED
jgi:hypothetical protein